MMLQTKNESNKYDQLEVKDKKKKIMEKNLDSISYPFESEYFKEKKNQRLLQK